MENFIAAVGAAIVFMPLAWPAFYTIGRYWADRLEDRDQFRTAPRSF